MEGSRCTPTDNTPVGRGIGKKLTELAVKVGKDKGYEVAFGICSDSNSARILTKHNGATTDHFVPYEVRYIRRGVLPR